MLGGHDSLAMVFGQRLKIIRTKKYSLSIVEAAKELGVHDIIVIRLEQGAYLPAPWLASRIIRWATHRETFSINDTSDKKNLLKLDSKYHEVKIRLCKIERQRLASKAKNLSLNQSDLIEIAIRKLLDNEAELSTLKEASMRIIEAQNSQALTESPEFRFFLSSDIQFLLDTKRIKEDNRQYKQDKQKEPLVKQFMNLSPEDIGLSGLEDWEEL